MTQGETAMDDTLLYHQGNRDLQDQFDSRRIADRLEEKLTRTRFSDGDRDTIQAAGFFFLATADAQGRPDCSFKGGAPGFVRVLAPDLMAFPDYDGNGMFKSMGNIAVNPAIGMLFIDMQGNGKRLRVNGDASIERDDPLLASTVGAQLIVRVRPRAIFPNCPRYIPRQPTTELSPYVPVAGQKPTEPAWKGFADFKDYVPKRHPTFDGTS